MFNNKPYIEVEICFDKVERFGDSYRPHLVPVEFQHELLGVQFDWFPQTAVGEKIIAIARLIYDEVDYSTLINGTGFLIREGGLRTVGKGKVLTVNGFDFSEFLKFKEYLVNKLSGNRKSAIDALYDFIESVSKNNDLQSNFCRYLCKVLDALQYQQGLLGTTYSRHWFNPQLKNLLYRYFSPLARNINCDFDCLKWHCLYARSLTIEDNEGYELCERALKQCDYKDKSLVSFYVNSQISGLSYAIHELPIGYLGSDDPYEDLNLINELRRMLSICYGDDNSSMHQGRLLVLSDIESEIKGYIKERRIKRE